MNDSRGFGSKIGFILSLAGFSIGIGSLWKFPYVVGANGGGAFLLVYIVAVIIIGIPMFMIETTLGRASSLSPILGMRKLEGKNRTAWSVIGWLEVIAISCICTFSHTVIGGWSLGYVWKVISGDLEGMSPDEISSEFESFSGSGMAIVFTVLSAILLWACLTSGVKKGVEKICSILMPALFIIMIGLAIYSNTLQGSHEGLMWYLTPDFSKITPAVIGAAVNQVFFSIGVGMLVAFVYGSYMQKTDPMPGPLTLTCAMVTFVAILAGLIITPALFAFDMEPTVGPSLIFITLPQLFNAMGTFGRIFGALFMLCVFAAGFSSMLGGCEALVATLTDSTNLSRKKSVIAVVGITCLLSIIVTFSFGTGTLSEIVIIKWGIFDFLDFISSGLCMPIAAILLYIYAIWKWGFPNFLEEVNRGAGENTMKIGNGFAVYFKYILPILLIYGVYQIVMSYIS